MFSAVNETFQKYCEKKRKLTFSWLELKMYIRKVLFHFFFERIFRYFSFVLLLSIQMMKN